MQHLDIAIFSLINASAATPHWQIQCAAFVSDVLPALAVGMFALGAIARPAWRRPLLAAVISVLLAWVLVTLFRSAIQVPRPAAMGLGTQWAAQGLRPGFPSMHATAGFAFAMSLLFARLHWPAAVFVTLGLAIGWSRVYLGLHFPSDVAAGAVLGSLLAFVVRIVLRRLRPRAASTS